jgi:hypothetical protein
VEECGKYEPSKKQAASTALLVSFLLCLLLDLEVRGDILALNVGYTTELQGPRNQNTALFRVIIVRTSDPVYQPIVYTNGMYNIL